MSDSLKTLEELNVQVGDEVVYHPYGETDKPGKPVKIENIVRGKFYSNNAELDKKGPFWKKVITSTTKTGGPSTYYDYPFKTWVTVNDLIDYMSQKHWGWRSYIFKDIIKACFRWGQKEDTSLQYDADKILYYSARLLLSVSDKETVRKALQKMLDDKQFKDV